MPGSVELTQDGPRYTGTDSGLRIERPSPDSFLLSQEYPRALPVYYRVDHGKIEWDENLAIFLNGSPSSPPDPGTLLALIHGTVPGPTTSFVPGVQRLATGSVVHIDAAGVTVARREPRLVDDGTSLRQAMRRALEEVGGDYAIAYSGGLSSAFVAVSALDAGHRPLLVHADFGGGAEPAVVPEIPGLGINRVRTDIAELLDHHWISGSEPSPPLPDTEVPRRLIARLRARVDVPVVAGSFLEDITSLRLPEVDTGWHDWRLLCCEPFHVTGTLRTLREARELVEHSTVFAPRAGDQGPRDEQPSESAPVPSPPDAAQLPGLTDHGADAYIAAQRGMLAMWKSHVDFVDPVIGHVDAGIEERGTGGALLPALAPGVLAAAAALPSSARGRIRRGVFQNHLPLYRALARHTVNDVRHRPPGHWLRLAAADYLHRERDKIINQLRRDCALGELGLIDPTRISELLRDGRELAARALPVLRLVWVDEWLRGRS